MKVMCVFILSYSDYFTEVISNTSLFFPDIATVMANYTTTINDTSINASGEIFNLRYTVDPSLFAVRTCQSYFQPQETIQYSNIGPFLEGMASGATEREDFIITPDLRGEVHT